MDGHFQVERSQKMSYLKGVMLEEVKTVKRAFTSVKINGESWSRKRY